MFSQVKAMKVKEGQKEKKAVKKSSRDRMMVLNSMEHTESDKKLPQRVL